MKPEALIKIEILSTPELMRLLKIKHKQTVCNLVREGLPATVASGHYRFDQAAIIARL